MSSGPIIGNTVGTPLNPMLGRDALQQAKEEIIQDVLNTFSSDVVRYNTAQTLTEEQKAQARENIGAMKQATGELGQVLSFDSDGNLVPMPLLEDVTVTETIAGNLFDASVGYTAGYNSPDGAIDLETLEVPLDKVGSAYILHNALIYLEPNTTYAITKFTGRATLYNAAKGARSSYIVPPSTNISEGDGCYLLTMKDTSYGYYLSIALHPASTPTAYEDMIVVKGDRLPSEEDVVVNATRLNENIKVSAEQIIGLEDVIPSGGLEPLIINGITYDGTETVEIEISGGENSGSGGTLDVTGDYGQVIGFDTNSDMTSIDLFEEISRTHFYNNLIDSKVGFIIGYTNPIDETITINSETLEVPLTRPAQSNNYALYSKLIYLKPDTTYAFSNFIGQLTIYNGLGSRNSAPDQDDLAIGENCLLYTTGTNSKGYYIALMIHATSPTPYNEMIICEGTSLDTTSTIITTKYLHNTMKVKSAQVEDLEDTISRQIATLRTDMVSEVISSLGTPVFGTIGEQNNIILNGSLSAGNYTFVYENAKGEQTVIGSHEILDENIPVYAATAGKWAYTSDNKIIYLDTVSTTVMNYYLVYREAKLSEGNTGIYSEAELTNKTNMVPIAVPEGATTVSVNFPNIPEDVLMRIYAVSAIYDEDLSAWTRVTNQSSTGYGTMTVTIPSGYTHIFLAGNADGYPAMSSLDLSNVEVTWG